MFLKIKSFVENVVFWISSDTDLMFYTQTQERTDMHSMLIFMIDKWVNHIWSFYRQPVK